CERPAVRGRGARRPRSVNAVFDRMTLVRAAPFTQFLLIISGSRTPSPPFRAEREGPIAKKWEGEVGIGESSALPHLTPTLSAPRGRGGRIRRNALRAPPSRGRSGA